ncbi:hypothetical protein [Saccharopolyspora hattusasensis]|uniref:hypothetical protein n=1 Tax=Saccharopolyspora hattusasensis TaxID=1128679 RepID=UPI003D979C72
MSDRTFRSASPAYAVGRWAEAVAAARTAAESGDAADRAREKVRRWEDVLSGMASGRLAIGSRVPVADTPAWVTLEVAHGGFATGRYLAEVPLSEDEAARLAVLPEGVPGDSDRERLNRWYLGDAGQAELLKALRDGHYRVDVPEEAALAVAAVLLDEGFPAQALDLVAELQPMMHRLRFTPRFEPVARPSGTAVRLVPVAEVVGSLRATRVPPQLAAMRATLGVWNPLYDRLVALWCSTVDGELPSLDDDGEVRGGWPCRRWPGNWADQRTRWLADYEQACEEHRPTGRHAHPKGNFARLRAALLACLDGSDALSAREVGWIRRALANTATRHGLVGSELREDVRAQQAVAAMAPTYAALAGVLAARLERYPGGGGLPSLDPVAIDVSEEDDRTDAVPVGTPLPAHLLEKASRALEAPVDELVRRGVITSGDVLARVLPQLTSRLIAARFDDPVPAGLYEQLYAAFRRRRGLLLLNLEHQVRFDELPWARALGLCRTPRLDSSRPGYLALQQATMLALTSFPQALLPNPLIRELGVLAGQAGVRMPLVEEVAADIFMGTFTTKWRDAAAVAGRTMSGTAYAAYYDLPAEYRWTRSRRSVLRWGKATENDFAELCAVRAAEAGRTGSYVARNGAVLEQSQILTTHNLAVLIDHLDLSDRLREHAPELAARTFSWVVRRLAQRTDDYHSALIQVKNAAYAWRQGIFLLSFCDPAAQLARVQRLSDEVQAMGLHARFGPAVDGLAHVLDGGRFAEGGTVPHGHGRRFLGWTAGQHWYFTHDS